MRTSFLGYVLKNDEYTILEKIGEGGFGTTYKAFSTTFQAIVVLKTINPNTQRNRDFNRFQQQFYNEARRLSICKHPSIVKIIDFFVEFDLPFIVMEYVPGYTLDKVVEREIMLPEATAVYYTHQIGMALQVVHENGLLHRDVKPQNIILRKGTHEVVLIDFGIAREFLGNQNRMHTSLATPGYAPVEQYLNNQPSSAATDVYSLASTLYTLVTGQIPIPATIRDRQYQPTPQDFRADLSEFTQKAILWGMEVEAQNRPQSMEQWLDYLLTPYRQENQHRGKTDHGKNSIKSSAILAGILGITLISLGSGILIALNPFDWRAPSPITPQTVKTPLKAESQLLEVTPEPELNPESSESEIENPQTPPTQPAVSEAEEPEGTEPMNVTPRSESELEPTEKEPALIFQETPNAEATPNTEAAALEEPVIPTPVPLIVSPSPPDSPLIEQTPTQATDETKTLVHPIPSPEAEIPRSPSIPTEENPTLIETPPASVEPNEKPSLFE